MRDTSSSSSRSHQTEGSEGSRYLSWGACKGVSGAGEGGRVTRRLYLASTRHT